ncbi:hypothetical protein VPNG_03617 [Cytospora leucostoma]|uniref:Uncharacterized protein n=1 Tax=Cytospora leucostoma TaxID=1230097 RepID=A0A423XD46_9PEZI|nr:hypothetical protein VPNG_03617 [Cytospora leucostoma]
MAAGGDGYHQGATDKKRTGRTILEQGGETTRTEGRPDSYPFLRLRKASISSAALTELVRHDGMRAWTAASLSPADEPNFKRSGNGGGEIPNAQALGW